MEARKEKSAGAKKDYARQCRKLSFKYNLDFGLCLTLGTKEQMYKRFIDTVDGISGRHYGGLDKAHEALMSKDLCKQRKSVRFLLGRNLYNDLELEWNDTNLKRVRHYLHLHVKWNTADQWVAPKRS